VQVLFHPVKQAVSSKNLHHCKLTRTKLYGSNPTICVLKVSASEYNAGVSVYVATTT
jgi:hypothetical protein